ncbi:Flp pilus assembly protein CpaB [Aeromicrobium sp. CTD01-1L150]|uniref:Flp pilus assembly protein CpaB n=1 Tax=Aeromicrobium sp. CTD01-1L150 TaxID=3341830 RepID=UPI0035BFD242
MNSRVLAIIGAVVLALLGALALFVYVQGAQDRAFEGTERVPVLQVTAEVAAKTPASELSGSVESVELPRAAVVDGAVTDLSEVDGLVTRGVLVPGDQLTTAKFAQADEVEGDAALPEGMQELAVPLSGARIVGGALAPGDEVGVFTSYPDSKVTSNPINNLLVLGVNTGLVAAEEGADGTQVTFAVETLDAERIVHAMEFGTVWLTKQNDETDTSGGRTITSKDVAP